VCIVVSEKEKKPVSWSRHPEEREWVQAAQGAYRWAYRMVHSHDVADDIAQEAFIRLHRALERIDFERPLSPWLCRVVINLATNYLRRKKTTISIEDNPGIESVISPSRDPQHPVYQHHRREFVAKLELAIDKLPPKFKEVFILRVQDNRSYGEIAEALGLTMGTVMSRLSRARSRLRDELAEELKKIRE